MASSQLVTRALHLAQVAHKRQTYNGLPFVVHPIRVALNLELDPKYCGPLELAAALLHDIVEDTPVTIDDLTQLHFPNEVVMWVDSLTAPTADKILQKRGGNSKRVTRGELKTAQRTQIRQGAVQAQVVKLADRLDNVKHILASTSKFPPWKKKRYVQETILLLAEIGDASPTLSNLIEKTLGEYHG